MSPVICSNCKTELAKEFAEGVERPPCPKCGSKIGSITLEAEVGHYRNSGVVAQLTVVSYPKKLLGTAEGLFKEGQYSVAVVVAHMACEIATERAMAEGFRTRNIADLEEPVEEMLNGYNLANDRLRKLYIALTGDEIHLQSFWSKFRESATRRNRIMHAGTIVSKEEADESLRATSALVEHLIS